MTPWSLFNRKLTDLEWTLLREWLKNNPEKRFHLGDERPEEYGVNDGKVFFAHARSAKGGERWITKECLDRIYERTRANNRKKWSDPEFKKKEREKIRKRRIESEEFRIRDRAYKSKWQKNNRGRRSSIAMRRIVNKRSLIHPELDRDIERTIYLQAAEIRQQTGENYHVDHIIPLCSGGWHHHDNLQILPEDINLQKGMNAFWTSENYLDWRDVSPILWPSGLAPTYSGLLAPNECIFSG